MQIKVIFSIIICFVISSCQDNPADVKVNVLKPKPTPIYVEPLKTPINNRSLASKGIVEADVEVSIYCRIQAQVVKKSVYEGMTVQKGDTLIVLNDEDIQSEIVANYCDLEQAKFQLEEILIGQGYKKAEFDNISKEIVELAKVQSGFNIAEHKYKVSQRKLLKTVIIAPISGVVTNLSIKPYDYPVLGTHIFKIIDNKKLVVVFSTLETEINKIKMKGSVTVSTVAYPAESHQATIFRISPVVDKNGMIKIKARLGSNTNLLPGMTAIVNI